MRKNILYIGIGPSTGGPIISLIKLVENLDKDKFSPFIFSQSNPHSNTITLLNDIEKINIIEKNIYINNWLKSPKTTLTFLHFIKTPVRWIKLFYNSLQLVKIIKDNNIHVVHTNIELILEGAIAAWLSRVPHIWHIRAPLGKNGVMKHFLGDKFCCSIISFLSERVIVNSNATKESISKYIDAKQIRLVYNGINPLEYHLPKSNNRLRHLIDVTENKKIIASIGYLSEIKGGREFINIALDVCRLFDDVVFVWIGPYNKSNDDKFRKEVFEIVEMNKMSNKIFFTDERNDINMLLSDVDIFLQPMVNGSWSRVVLEAMAASIPIIAIERNLTSEFIQNKINGILVRNEIEAVESIKDILYHKYSVNQLTEAGYKMVSTHFTNEITASIIMKIYDEII